LNHANSNCLESAFLRESETKLHFLKPELKNKVKSCRTVNLLFRDEKEREEIEGSKVTPEIIAKVTGAENVLMPHSFFMRNRMNNLFTILEDFVMTSAAMEVQ